MRSLSVIVPATDAPATLRRCLDAINAADEGPDEVIVVAEDGLNGPAHARNVGAMRAQGSLLAFVDADVEVHPDAFARIRSAFDADPELAVLFGSYDDAPPAKGAVSGFRNLLHHHVHQSCPGVAMTFWAGLGVVGRNTFEACGGFDEDRFPHSSVEDVELGIRLAWTGRRCVLDPAIQGTHLKAWTLRSMIHTDFRRRGVPWVLLLLRAGADGAHARGVLNLGPRHKASMGLAVAAALGLPARRPLLSAAAFGTMAWLNRDLYRLIARRRGRVQATLGVGLHAVHHLTAAAAVPVAAVIFGSEQLRPRGRPEPFREPVVIAVIPLPPPVGIEQPK
jgi:glycosyltransferase involved in cell wall biosynthesis